MKVANIFTVGASEVKIICHSTWRIHLIVVCEATKVVAFKTKTVIAFSKNQDNMWPIFRENLCDSYCNMKPIKLQRKQLCFELAKDKTPC